MTVTLIKRAATISVIDPKAVLIKYPYLTGRGPEQRKENVYGKPEGAAIRQGKELHTRAL